RGTLRRVRDSWLSSMLRAVCALGCPRLRPGRPRLSRLRPRRLSLRRVGDERGGGVDIVRRIADGDDAVPGLRGEAEEGAVASRAAVVPGEVRAPVLRREPGPADAVGI